MGEEAVLEGVKKYGPSAGGKAMMDFEYIHAKEALESGLYVTYYSEAKKHECGRIGSQSMCFCGHMFPDHDIKVTKKKQSSKCTQCKCKDFRWVPQRPEECGMWWLPRRKGFKVSEWAVKCKCKLPHHDHRPVRPYRAKPGKGGCNAFVGDFACISCDCRWEDHTVLYEFEHDRMMEGKKIREDYLPLNQNKELHNLVFNTDRKALPNYNRVKKKPKRGGRGRGRGRIRGSKRGRVRKPASRPMIGNAGEFDQGIGMDMGEPDMDVRPSQANRGRVRGRLRGRGGTSRTGGATKKSSYRRKF